MTDITTAAEEVIENFPDDLDATATEVEEKLEQLTDEFSVPLDEAKRSVTDQYEDDYDGEFSATPSTPSSSGDEQYDIADLDVSHDEEWLTIEGTVQQFFELSESQAEWIEQRGVIADDTGTIVFTVPQRAVDEDPSLKLEEGETYRLESIVGDAFNDQLGIDFTTTSSAEKIDAEYEPPENDTEITGSIVDIQNGSGYVERCSEDGCTLTLTKSKCPEHGDIEEGVPDLRLKTVIDNGEDSQQVFFGKEATEAITGIQLDEAKQMAKDAMDTEVVIDEMRPKVLHKYYEIAGNQVGDYAIVNEFDRVEQNWEAEGETVREKLQDVQSEATA